MRKSLSIYIIILLCCLVLSSCGKQQSSGILPEKNVEGDVYVAESSSEQQKEEPEPELIDLTSVSKSMLYPTVFDMLAERDRYIGKYVKLRGTFGVYDGDDGMIFACCVLDVTECCEVSLEFRNDELSYPEDFPEIGAEFTVSGIFETYTDSHGIVYSRLRDAVIEK